MRFGIVAAIVALSSIAVVGLAWSVGQPPQTAERYSSASLQPDGKLVSAASVLQIAQARDFADGLGVARQAGKLAKPISDSVPLAVDSIAPSQRVLLVPRATLTVRGAVAELGPQHHASASEDGRTLAINLQTELKRVGCYDAEPTGVWGPASKKAMSDFLSGINATLPFDAPDLILLTIVRGHPGRSCGGSCPEGQTLTKAGTKAEKCWPDALVALALRDERTRLAARTDGAVRRRAPSETPRVAAAVLPKSDALLPSPAVAPSDGRIQHRLPVRQAITRSAEVARHVQHRRLVMRPPEATQAKWQQVAVRRQESTQSKRQQVAAIRPVRTSAPKYADNSAKPQRSARVASQAKAGQVSWQETIFANRSGGG